MRGWYYSFCPTRDSFLYLFRKVFKFDKVDCTLFDVKVNTTDLLQVQPVDIVPNLNGPLKSHASSACIDNLKLYSYFTDWRQLVEEV